MPKLSRLRFISIGHPNARMQDLTLNLSDPSGMPSDSTLWLRNGGGKSSILSLFFALPRPNRRDFLGSRADAKQRRIEDYVLTNDRSVVAAEWTLDTQTLGLDDDLTMVPRFLTGVFYEYAGGNKESLRRLFFCARVSDGVEATQLPTIPVDMTTADGGKVRRTLMSFRQHWHTLRDEHPSLQFYCTENQSEWSEKLQSAGLDPGLFGYQLIMNSREGGADELFRFNSPDDFIDFLLELTVEPSRTDGITENLETYRKQLQRRKHELLPDLNLSTGLIERLTPLVELHERRLRTMEEAERLTALHARIRGSIVANTALFAEQEQKIAEDVKQLRTRWNDVEARVQRDRGLAIALAMRLAEAEVKKAQKQVDDLTESVEQAKRDEILWRAAYPYRDYVIAQKDAEAFRARLSGANVERAPLLAKLEQVASDYVAAMRHQSQALRVERDEIRRNAAEREDESRELETEAQKLEREAFAYESESESYKTNMRARQEKFESLIKLAILQANETPAEALTRTENTLKTRKNKLRSLERSREGNAALEDECSRMIQELQQSVADKQAEIRALERDWQKATQARDTLESDAHFLSMLDLDEIDLDEVADDTGALLQRHASEMQEEAARLRTEAASLERARVHIMERGLMPPSVEVETLLSFLGPKSQAKSGWSYICDNLQASPEEKEKLVRTWPAIAQGIIVPARDFERTRSIIESNPDMVPGVPITLATPEIFDAVAETMPARYQCVLGPKDHAWFDKNDAQNALASLEKRLESIHDDIDKALRQQDDFLSASMKFKTFRGQYPKGWFTATKAKLARLRVQSEDDEARLEMQKDEKKRLLERSRSDEREAGKLNNEILGLRSACDKLSEFVNEIDDSMAHWQAASDEKYALSMQRREEAEALRVQAREIREKARALLQTAEPVGTKASLLDNEISRVKYVNQMPDAKQGPIEELKNDYQRLLDQVEREYTNNELARNLENAEKQAKKDKNQVMQLIRGVLTLDDVKAAVEGLTNPNDLETNGERASEMLAIVTGRKEKAIADLSSKNSMLKQRQNEWYGAGKPSIPEDVAVKAENVEKYEKAAADGQVELRKIDDAIRAQERQASNARHAREALTKDLERLNSVQRSHAAFLKSQQPLALDTPIEAPEIGAAITDLEQRLEKYREAHDGLDSTRRSAVTAIRKWVDHEQFSALQNRIITQFKTLDAESLETGAAEFRESLNIRLREITATLEEMEKHRSFLAKFLLNAADDGLRLLKLADSASIVPREVPDIGGSRFLRITTKEPSSQADRMELIQELVDTLVDETVIPTGTKLIQRAVRQLARPFTVRVLNPDPASPQRLIEITETARFSGGEQLTCAILLYCTLANVRARTRGMNRQPTSVLILDNPIGRASRTVFINMQRQFASAMGIQLIYTTAVNDLEALSILPNVVRLRNERTDLNRGHRLLEADVDISGRLEAIRLARAVSPEDAPENVDVENESDINPDDEA
ncbi:MAG: hypothetical protein J6S69_02295 [Proteobacteria bacterium]|nr:hypothetical protein [Pseudomonadota bacterium]